MHKWFCVVLMTATVISAQGLREPQHPSAESSGKNLAPEGSKFPDSGTPSVQPAHAPQPEWQKISMSAGDWDILYSMGTPPHPTPNWHGDGWFLNVPLYTRTEPCYDDPKCPFVGYVMTDVNTKFTQSQTVTMVFEVEAWDATFDFQTESDNTCTQPGDFSIMIEHTNDAALTEDYYRWWAFPEKYTFANGTYDTGKITLSIPLDPELWISVYGEAGNSSPAAEAGFANTLANIGRVGFTMGGGCFAGHGLYLTSGSARFIVDSYTVQ
jgi:hypothetical protein